MICKKKGKVLLVIQYQFNVSVNSPLASINTNCTSLASSSSPPVREPKSTTDTNSNPRMEADATSGKKTCAKTGQISQT